MSTIVTAFRDGVLRVLRAPAVWIGVFLLTIAITVPPGLVLESSIAESLGNSLAADRSSDGVDMEWWTFYGESAQGVGTTFTPSVIGFAAFLDNLSRLMDGGFVPEPVMGTALLYLVVWVFLVGGILDRYARNRVLRAQAFFSACGTYVIRFVRLGILAVIGYGFLFWLLHGWLIDDLWGWATRNWTVERNAVILRLGLYAVFGVLLLAWNLVLDYAKIRAVVEDRRSMLGALFAGTRFVARHPGRTVGLYALNGAAFVFVVVLYAALAPGAAGSGMIAWLGFAVGLAFLAVRLFAKLLFYASQTALFQASLAHAEYTAAPVPVWPDSPAAEAIANAAGQEVV
ncbi:MAG: hypothetical protein AB1806_01975 [Acidobacteriota bacterium]